MISLPVSSASLSKSAAIRISSDAGAAVVFLFGIVALAKPCFESIYHLLGRLAECSQVDFRLFRRFIRRIQPGEVLDLAIPRLGVEALGIALGAFFERRIDEHLHELARRHDLAREAPLGAER